MPETGKQIIEGKKKLMLFESHLRTACKYLLTVYSGMLKRQEKGLRTILPWNLVVQSKILYNAGIALICMIIRLITGMT